PNPFSELLDIFPGNPTAESIHLQMYNLSGQKVLDQQFAGGQEQYSLSTAGLSTGFYLLRIEADGEVQTLKVVKSE
ncbi:MAG: T9SS type A sorting domain-containing protein, partial [Phycisphaerae bacterium]|nr:T9SS type A sorting domain-containing protein [Saprospiraceae bacterium]